GSDLQQGGGYTGGDRQHQGVKGSVGGAVAGMYQPIALGSPSQALDNAVLERDGLAQLLCQRSHVGDRDQALDIVGGGAQAAFVVRPKEVWLPVGYPPPVLPLAGGLAEGGMPGREILCRHVRWTFVSEPPARPRLAVEQGDRQPGVGQNPGRAQPRQSGADDGDSLLSDAHGSGP